MSSKLHLENACVILRSTSLKRGNPSSLHPLFFQKGLVEIGKLNIFLIGLIIVIMFALIAQDEDSTLLSTQNVRVQTFITPEIADIDKQDNPVSETQEQAIAEQQSAEQQPAEQTPAESKPSVKKHKKLEKTTTVIDSNNQVESVNDTQATQAEPVAVTQERREPEHATQKETSRNIIVFNIWSVSELRLRSAFTKLINDSSAPATILESRKKEYLSFVNKRSHKCGDLNNKFASNINTVERLTFKEKDLDILECHTSENTTEINRLNELGVSIS